MVVDQDLIVDADLVEEGGSSNSAGEVGEDIWNDVHEEVFGFGVVEAEEGEVLEDGEEQPSVDFWYLFVLHDLDVIDEGLVDALGHVELLEEIVVLLLFGVEVVDYRFVEDFLLHVHQRLDVLEGYFVFEGAGQEEEILDYSGTFVVLSPQVIIGLEDGVCIGFAGDPIPLVNGVVLEHGEFVPHEFEVDIDFPEVTFATDVQILVGWYDIAALLEHGPEHSQSAVEERFILEAWQFEEAENYLVEGGEILAFGHFEEVSVFVGFVTGFDGLKRDHGLNFVVPEGFLHHHILVLAVFFDLASQDIDSKDFVELNFSELIFGNQYFLLLLGFFRFTVRGIKFVQILLLDIVVDVLAVVFNILCGLVDSLEEVHEEPQADVDFHLVHVVEYLGGFAFAVDGQGYFGFIFPESLFSEVNPVFSRAVSFFCGLVILFKEEIAVNFDDIFDEEGDDISELIDRFP